MGDLIGSIGFLNTSTPFSLNEHKVEWKSDRTYLDFAFSNNYNKTCEYPRFWLETGEPLGQDVTDQMVGCYDSEFDQVCFPFVQRFLAYLITSKSTVILKLSVSSRIGNASCQNSPLYKIVSCLYFGLHNIY